MKDKFGIIQGYLKGSRKLGQHFLTDEKVLDTLISEVHKLDPKTIIEVGSGFGDITERLSKIAIEVIGVEKSVPLFNFAKKRLETYKNVKVINEDVLNVKFPRDSIVVGAPPYSISTPLMKRILISRIAGAVLILQTDFVEKLSFGAGNPKRGYLSVLIDLLGDIATVVSVNRESFYPPPEVSSEIVKIVLNKKIRIGDFELIRFTNFISNLLKTSRLKMAKSLTDNLPLDMKKAFDAYPGRQESL